MACTTGCRTRDHNSYAECLRSKSVRAVGVDISKGFDGDTQKTWDRNLDAYRAARSEGIQPASTDRAAVDRAVRLSDAAGKAYEA